MKQVLPTYRYDRSLMALLCLLSVFLTGRATAQATVKSNNAQGAHSPQANTKEPEASTDLEPRLKQDTRLDLPISLTAKSATLKDSLAGLSEATHIRLKADPGVQDRRITAITYNLPYRDLMTSIAKVTSLSWRAGQHSDTFDYELYRSPKNSAWEERERLDFARRVETATNLKRQALLDAVGVLISEDKSAVGALLSVLRPDQLRKIADVASEDDISVIVAGNMSHLHQHLLFATPYSALPEETRAILKTLLEKPGLMPDNQATPLPDLADRQIGFVAAFGGVSLATVSADGKDLTTFGQTIQRKGLPGVDSDDDSDPEVLLSLTEHMIALNGAPATIHGKVLHFPRELKRIQLTEVLESISRQTGLSIVADDYLQSRWTPFSWLLTDKDQYSLTEALEQVAHAFGHRMSYTSGALCVTTVTLGRDVASEPPAALLSRLHEQNVNGPAKQFSLEDDIALGRLSSLQLKTIIEKGSPSPRFSANLIRAQQIYGILHLYAILSDKQRRQAEAKTGLPSDQIKEKEAYRMFQSLSDRGLPGPLPEKERPQKPGFYIRHAEKSNESGTWTFMIVAENPPYRVSTYRLEIP